MFQTLTRIHILFFIMSSLLYRQKTTRFYSLFTSHIYSLFIFYLLTYVKYVCVCDLCRYLVKDEWYEIFDIEILYSTYRRSHFKFYDDCIWKWKNRTKSIAFFNLSQKYTYSSFIYDTHLFMLLYFCLTASNKRQASS